MCSRKLQSLFILCLLKYDWVVPFPGEFHFVVHLLMAIHILWYTQLVGYVLLHSGVSTESIVEKWDSVEKYNRHRFFYEALIVGALEYLKEVIPKELMSDPVALLQRAKRNKGPNHLHMHLIDGNWLNPHRRALGLGDLPV